MVISRFVRVAQELSGAYSNDRIFEAIKTLKANNEKSRERGFSEVDFTLDTVKKQLTK